MSNNQQDISLPKSSTWKNKIKKKNKNLDRNKKKLRKKVKLTIEGKMFGERGTGEKENFA